MVGLRYTNVRPSGSAPSQRNEHGPVICSCAYRICIIDVCQTHLQTGGSAWSYRFAAYLFFLALHSVRALGSNDEMRSKI